MSDPAGSTEQKPAVTPEKLVYRLQKLLNVETLDRDLYRGMALPGGTGRVFGGQVIGQALISACRSVDDERLPHSLHAYFLRAGDNTVPIIFQVLRDADGRSFSNRRVVAMQRGEPILNMAVSFQLPEQGKDYTVSMPDVPPPEALKSEAEHVLENRDRLPPQLVRFMTSPRPVEMRPVYSRSLNFGVKREPVNHVWIRTVAEAEGADQPMHRAILAYMSDMGLLSTCGLPHGLDWFTPNFQSASLDHTVWFHEDIKADEWMLYSMQCPWTGHARGMNFGSLYSRDGRLIASTAQEGLMRLRS
jgi:acyl-CoA thioesterase-2